MPAETSGPAMALAEKKAKIAPNIQYLWFILSPEKHSIAPDSREISVTARVVSLPRLLAWVELEATAGGIDDAKVKRIQLTVEELFANTIHHGYRKESDATIWLTLHISANMATLVFCDSATPFNLLEATSLPASVERLGGVGLNLIRALTSKISYRYENNRNITTLFFQINDSVLHSTLSN
jgi:anti-sigma regulatory factor (Ser/Thr protein kinase)